MKKFEIIEIETGKKLILDEENAKWFMNMAFQRGMSEKYVVKSL